MSSQPCLRNMSCTCPLCSGEDLGDLLKTLKTSASTIYDNDAENQTHSQNQEQVEPVESAVEKKPKKMVRNSPLKSTITLQENVLKRVVEPAEPPPLAKETSSTPTPDQPTEQPVASEGETNEKSISERLKSKIWKDRKSAYEEMKTVFDSGTKPVNEYDDMFPTIAAESNVGALQAGLDAILAYLGNENVSGVKVCEEMVTKTMPKLLDKGFTSRPTVVQTAQQIVLTFIEVGAGNIVLAALLEGVKNRKPKIPPLCVECIVQALEQYGPRVISIADIKPHLVKMCESTVKNVRPAAMKLLVGIYQWTGSAVLEDVVANLRQAQKTEYEAAVKDIEAGQAAPTCFIRGSKPKVAKKGTLSGGSETATAAPDPREFVPVVKLLDALQKTEFKQKLDATKWSEKVAALTIVLDTIGPVPNLAAEDYGEFVGTLKRLLSHSNIAVVSKTIKVFGTLASGLRKSFSMYAKMLYPIFLQKLSDKKPAVITAVNEALDLFQEFCVPLEVMIDDIKTNCDSNKNRAPPSRVRTLGFLERGINQGKISTNGQQGADIAGIALKATADSDPTVREAAVELFAVMLKKASPDALSSIQPSVDELKSTNARIYAKLDEKVHGKKAAPVLNKKTVAKAPVKGLSGGKEKPASKKSPRASSSVSTSQPRAESRNNEGSGDSSSTMELETAETMMERLGIEDWACILTMLKGSKWSERVDALTKIKNHVLAELQGAAGEYGLAATTFVGANTKNFKDSNINVLRASFDLMATFATCSDTPAFPQSAINQLIPPAVDKIGDRKTKTEVYALLLALSECAGPQYVIERIQAYLPTVRPPLVLEEVGRFFGTCVADFGVRQCNTRLLCTVAKSSQGLDAANPKVKVAWVAMLGAVYNQIGPQLETILNIDDMKPQLAKMLKSEFGKVGYDANSASAFTRKVKGDAGATSADDDSGGRTDVSSKITRELIDQMASNSDKADWKKRLRALESVQQICKEAGMAIEGTKTAIITLMKSLKARLSDSNGNLRIKAAQTIGIVASSLGTKTASCSKFVLTDLLGCVADSKKMLQAAAIEACTKWVKHDGETSEVCLEAFIPYLAIALENPVGRAELLSWAREQLAGSKVDMQCLVEPIILCLQDRTVAARENAQSVLELMAPSLGEDFVLEKCQDLKPGVMRALKPMIDKAFATSGIVRKSSRTIEEPPVVIEAPKSGHSSPESKPTSTKAKLTKGGFEFRKPSIKAPASTAAPSTGPSTLKDTDSAASSKKALSFTGDKTARLEKIRSSKWIFEEASEIDSLTRQLEVQWSPFLDIEFKKLAFAPSHEKGLMQAITTFSKVIEDCSLEVIDSLDFVLKWATFRIVDNNVQALAKTLDMLEGLFTMLESRKVILHEVEAAIFLPYLIQECGQQKPRFRIKFRNLLRMILKIVDLPKYPAYIIRGFSSKNTRSRCECLSLAAEIIENYSSGMQWFGRQGLSLIGKAVAVHEKDVREAALSAVVQVYYRCHEDEAKCFRLCDIQDQKSKDLLKKRFKAVKPSISAGLPPHPPAAAASVPISSELPPPAPLQELDPSEDNRQSDGYHPVENKGVEDAGPTETSRSKQQLPIPVNLTTPVSKPNLAYDPLRRIKPPVPPPRVQESPLQYDDSHIDIKNYSQTPMVRQSVAPPTTTRGYQGPPAQKQPQETPCRTAPRAHPNVSIMLMQMACILDSPSKIYPVSSQQYTKGKESIKMVYQMAMECKNEEAFRRMFNSNLNEIVRRLLSCVSACFGSNEHEGIHIHILSLAMATLKTIFENVPTTEITADTVQNCLAELCARLLDSRLESQEDKYSIDKFSNVLDLDNATGAGAPTYLTQENRRRLRFAFNATISTIMTSVDRSLMFVTLITMLMNDFADRRNSSFDFKSRSKPTRTSLIGYTLRSLINLEKENHSSAFVCVDSAQVLRYVDEFFRTTQSIASTTEFDEIFVIVESLVESIVQESKLHGKSMELQSYVEHMATDSRLSEILQKFGFVSPPESTTSSPSTAKSAAPVPSVPRPAPAKITSVKTLRERLEKMKQFSS